MAKGLKTCKHCGAEMAAGAKVCPKPGGKVSGVVTFEVPKDDKNLKLQYMGNVFNDKPLLEFQIDGTAK